MGDLVYELVTTAYFPLIDRIGQWCLGLIAAWFAANFILWFWKQL